MIDNLEIGKVYYVEVDGDGFDHWLFKKDVVSPITSINAIASCRYCMCLDNGYRNNGGASRLCRNTDIKVLKPANLNHIAIWNRVFNDNIEIV